VLLSWGLPEAMNALSRHQKHIKTLRWTDRREWQPYFMCQRVTQVSAMMSLTYFCPVQNAPHSLLVSWTLDHWQSEQRNAQA
jgi:hypothetical protein